MKLNRVSRILALSTVLLPVSTIAGQSTAIVVAAGARIYDRPTTISEVKKEVPIRTSVRLLDTVDGWSVVRIDDLVGWMPPNTLSSARTSSGSAKGPSSSALGLLGNGSAGHARPSTAAERVYIRGPRGGCYYINRSGNKTYVDRSLC